MKILLVEDEKVEIKRIRMIFKGPNSETLFTQKINMNYETEGNNQWIQEFAIDKNMRWVINVISGKLVLNRCLLSLNGAAQHITEKVPCIVGCPETCLDIKSWFLFGDSYKEVVTCGIHVVDPFELFVYDTVIKDHLGGGIIISLQPESQFQVTNSKIINCETAGIFVQGEGSEPVIEGNEIK